MKKVLSIIITLLFITNINILSQNRGGMFHKFGSSVLTANHITESQYCPEYRAVYNAMTNKPSETHAGYQNAMVKSLVDGGYWTGRMELFYVLAQYGTASTELSLNWVAPTGSFNLSDAGSVNPYEHAVQYQGIDFNGTDDYLATNYIPSSSAVNISVNDATIGVWMLTNTASRIAIGAISGTGVYMELWPKDINTLTGSIGSGDNTVIGSLSATSGFSLLTRRAEAEIEGYFNGSSLGTDDNTSYFLPDDQLFIGASNNDGGGPTALYDGIISIILVMDAVSDSDAAAIYNILDTYMTAIGN